MDFKDACGEWKRFDANRPSLPGEHWLTAAAGAGLLVAATRSNCPVTAALQALAGGALLFRAASGRDGLRSLCASRGQGRPYGEDDESGYAQGRGTDSQGARGGYHSDNPPDVNLGRS
jgi:hypothetical protein